jgi:hypothetical protein
MLPGAISARAIIRSADLGAGAGRARPGRRFERTANTALRTAYPGNLASLGDCGYDVSALLLALGAELIDAITNGVGRLFHLCWHEKQTRFARQFTVTRTRPSLIRLIELDWSAAEVAALPKTTSPVAYQRGARSLRPPPPPPPPPP